MSMYSEYKDSAPNNTRRPASESLTATAQSINHSAGESTEEGGYTSRRTTSTNGSKSGGIQNSELQAHLVSNDDLMLNDLENGRTGGGGTDGEFLVPKEHDPFYVVKEDVLIKLEMTDDSLLRYQRTVENTDTAVNTHDVKETKKQLRRHTKNVESTLRDLSSTLRLVETQRDRFPNISDAELYERRTFVCTCADRIKHTRAEMNAEAIRTKLMSDERAKAQRRMGFRGERSLEVREDEGFLEKSQASAHLMLRQQDETLEELDEAVGRVGNMAENIHEELGQQNKTLGSLEEDLEDAEEKLGLVMGKLAKMLKTKSKLQLGTILLLSAVVIVLVVLVIYT